VVKIKTNYNDPLGITAGIFYLRKALPALLILLTVQLWSQPKLSVEQKKINFGFVKRGTIVKNDYTIKNEGTEPLIIKDVEVSCSCTSTEFSKVPILPGKQATVTVVFNTTTVYGRQDRTVLVHSNDPGSPHPLRYKGTVSKK
jgi:hypothetical protein